MLGDVELGIYLDDGICGRFKLRSDSELAQVLWDECEELGIHAAVSREAGDEYPSLEEGAYKKWPAPTTELDYIVTQSVAGYFWIFPNELCQLAGMGSKVARRLVLHYWRSGKEPPNS